MRGALWLQSQDLTEAQGRQISRKRRRICKSSALKSFFLSHLWSGLGLDAALNIHDLKSIPGDEHGRETDSKFPGQRALGFTHSKNIIPTNLLEGEMDIFPGGKQFQETYNASVEQNLVDSPGVPGLGQQVISYLR